MTLEWYETLADIIGAYEPLADVDRSRLRGADFRPRPSEWTMPDGTEVWRWDSISQPGVEEGQSPVSQRAYDPLPEDLEHVRRTISETLLLPGEASDYHFALLGAYDALWRIRRQHPSISDLIEKLCLLDVRLVEARPEAVRMPGAARNAFVSIPAFQRLFSLYLDEGYLAEALEIAERAVPFGQSPDLTNLRERLAVLLAEVAP
ncbi:MAG: hypothetical protein WEA29_09865 [Acidimicrobiia bacterium]